MQKTYTITFMNELAETFEHKVTAKSSQAAHLIALGMSEEHNYGIVKIIEAD